MVKNGIKTMNKQIRIADKIIGENNPPFIIAEMSGNHNRSLERALEIVEEAAKAGADAIKIQTYTADTMTLDINDGEFFIADEKSLWKGISLYKLYETAHTPWDWHKAIFDKAAKCGIIAFSSPFDETAVDFLEELNAPCYKIASFECADVTLIKKVAVTGKPVIISTGMASEEEVKDAVDAFKQAGGKDLILLKCTSAYPATAADANLNTIPDMRKKYSVQVGLSDHTHGIGVPVAATVLGATVIEKHFTLKRSDGGVDSAFSLEPNELKSLVVETKKAWQSLGRVQYGVSENEKNNTVFRRSIYVSKDIKEGDRFSEDNIRRIRPGYGLAPKYYEQIIGKTAASNLKKGKPLSFEDIKDKIA